MQQLIRITDEAHIDDSPISLQQHLLNDIEAGLCKLIVKVTKPTPYYVVLYKGLLIDIGFDEIGHNITIFHVRDKEYFSFDQFINDYGKDFKFSHVMFREHHHFIYVIPTNIRPWMVRTIASGNGNLYWCICRHFVQYNGPLPDHFKNLATRKDLDVNHYLRDDAGVFYTKTTFDLMMSMSFPGITPMDSTPS